MIYISVNTSIFPPIDCWIFLKSFSYSYLIQFIMNLRILFNNLKHSSVLFFIHRRTISSRSYYRTQTLRWSSMIPPCWYSLICIIPPLCPPLPAWLWKETTACFLTIEYEKCFGIHETLTSVSLAVSFPCWLCWSKFPCWKLPMERTMWQATEDERLWSRDSKKPRPSFKQASNTSGN